MALSEAEELELLELEEAEYQSQNGSGAKTQGLFGSSVGENSDLLRKLRIPADKSREGLKMITGAIPDARTQSVPLNFAINTPRTLMEIGSEFSAGMLDPETAFTAGALKAAPLLSRPANAVGRFIGKTMESTSGLGYKTPGVLAETVANPKLPFGPGVDEARKAYSAVQDSSAIRDTLKEPVSPMNFIKRSLKAVNDKSITPDEALEARKAVDMIGDGIPDIVRKTTREVFNKIAKLKFADADKAYSQAIKSEALRSFWGINKSGTPSIVKGGLLLGVGKGLGTAALSPLLSPAVQAGMASTLGLAKRFAAPMLPMLRNPGRTAIFTAPTLKRLRDE